MQRFLFNFTIAIESILLNKLRTFLTALGIIFGVGAVIAMLAIGTGAKQSILDQMKLIGTNNIVIKSIIPEISEDEGNGIGSSQRIWSPGLTLNDMDAIADAIPIIEQLSPEIILPVSVIYAGKLIKAKCIGIQNDFFQLNNISLSQGNFFHPIQTNNSKKVCIIGKNIQIRFFPEENPIGKQIKCGNTWLSIIGVLENRNFDKKNLKSIGIRDYNDDVYIPVQTALLHFKNRAKISKKDLGSEDGNNNNDDQENKAVGPKNYHQLDKLVVKVTETKYLEGTANVISRILHRKHKKALDFEVQVPELLLEQQQKTQDTFNFVLAIIAGISLLVGGIGIMNIMLASVLERTKEIGIRRSLGANRNDIITQFLFEAISISLIGGLIGIFIGITSASLIADYADIPTIVSNWSIFLSFGVAATVGLTFGIFPAQKAAVQDPIKALRSD